MAGYEVNGGPDKKVIKFNIPGSAAGYNQVSVRGRNQCGYGPLKNNYLEAINCYGGFLAENIDPETFKDETKVARTKNSLRKERVLEVFPNPIVSSRLNAKLDIDQLEFTNDLINLEIIDIVGKTIK